jgi:hypothetical protein
MLGSTWRRHLTRSRGVTAVCVGPDRIYYQRENSSKNSYPALTTCFKHENHCVSITLAQCSMDAILTDNSTQSTTQKVFR